MFTLSASPELTFARGRAPLTRFNPRSYRVGLDLSALYKAALILVATPRSLPAENLPFRAGINYNFKSGDNPRLSSQRGKLPTLCRGTIVGRLFGSACINNFPADDLFDLSARVFSSCTSDTSYTATFIFKYPRMSFLKLDDH